MGGKKSDSSPALRHAVGLCKMHPGTGVKQAGSAVLLCLLQEGADTAEQCCLTILCPSRPCHGITCCNAALSSPRLQRHSFKLCAAFICLESKCCVSLCRQSKGASSSRVKLVCLSPPCIPAKSLGFLVFFMLEIWLSGNFCTVNEVYYLNPGGGARLAPAIFLTLSSLKREVKGQASE